MNEDREELDTGLPEELDEDTLPSSGEARGALSSIVKAAPPEANPSGALQMGVERLKQLSQLKAQMKAQAAARQAAMENVARAYQTPVDTGMDPGLIALGKGIASKPASQGLLGFTEGMQGMADARQKLAERQWARDAAAAKVRAEAEQQNMTDILNQAKLDISLTHQNRPLAPRDYVANGRHMRDTYDQNTGQWVSKDLGAAPSGADKLPVGMTWVDPNDHSKGIKQIPGSEKLPKDMRWVDPNDHSLGVEPIPGGPADPKTNGVSVGSGIGGWTDDAIQEAAIRYANGDVTVLQNIGMGKDAAPVKAEIRNRAAKIHKDAGVDPSDVTDYAQNQRAIAGALLQITKQKTSIGAFERTALNNLDLALQASSKVDRTGVPIFNQWLQAGRVATGDSAASKFHAANETFINEYAKVMSGGTGAAATTDSATAHARSLLNTAMTPEQYKSVMDQLKQEMDSRMLSFDQEIEHLKAGRPGAKNSAKGTPLPKTNSKGWVLHTDSQGRKAYVSSDNTQYEAIK